MTVASLGLTTALARAGSAAGVVAISELSAADLLASMSDTQRAELTATLAPAPLRAAMPVDGEDKCSKCSEPMKDGKCSKCSPSEGASAADSIAAARAEERGRFNAVMSSAHYAGNEALASTLLANDKLTGAEIVAALAVAKPAGGNASAEEAARAEMRAALTRPGNSGIDAGGGASAGQPANHSAGWAKAAAAVNRRYNL